MAEPRPLQPGDPSSIGSYALVGRLGEGGQGVVYLGRSPEGEQVAVKLLRDQFAGDTRARERFVRELAVARRVSGFCTARVLDAETAGDRPYIVSEFVPGQSLHEMLAKEGPQSGDDLIRLAIGTATALAAIHEAGIVHRDFKPPNVLLGPEGPRVIDFGIARALDTTSSMTSQVIGTPAFMAPEQIANQPVGPYTDMFAWGVTILAAATGGSPFAADSIPGVLHKVLYEQPDVRMLAEPLAGLVHACLSKDPAQRPTATQVLLTLLGSVGAAPNGAPAGAALSQGATLAATRTLPHAQVPTQPPAWIPQPPPNAAFGPAVTPNAPHRQGWPVIAPVLAASLAVGFASSSLSPLIPVMGRDLELPVSGLAWIVNIFLLGALAVALPASRIADMVGRKKVFVVGAVVFLCGTVAVAISPAETLMLAARALQGMGAGALAGASIALIRSAFPAERVGVPIGVWATASALSIGVGPLVSGVMAENADWRVVFYLDAVAALVALVLGALILRESRGLPAFPVAEVLAAIGLTMLALGFQQSTDGWLRALTLLPLLAGTALLVAGLVASRPIFSGLLRDPSVTAGAAVIGISFFGSYALYLYTSIDLQQIQGLSMDQALTAMLPAGLVGLLVAPLAGRLAERSGPRTMMALGSVLLAVALIALAIAGTSVGLAVVWMILGGAGLSMILVCGTTAMARSSTEDMAGILGGVHQSVTALGGVVGVALLSGILSNVVSDRMPKSLSPSARRGASSPVVSNRLPLTITRVINGAYLDALHTTLWVAAGVVLVSAVFAAFVRSRQAQPHMLISHGTSTD